MTHIVIQILRWVMQPKVWRFVGFVSSIVGLLCYALSSSFNYLFGEWNLLKISLYSVFSFIICVLILFAKTLQGSRSLGFKAHTAFLVLTITSIYSFFFDKVVNGKPDAYSLISCAAFAIMSLSLSRQTQCGFEIDLLYFFLGCLIVQLMKIKMQLLILGVGFSYSLIILRSCFSSIDARRESEYHELQDANSVVLHMDSLQQHSITTTNIAISSASNSFKSPQLVPNNIDISSMIEQMGTCVKALLDENSNMIQMLLEHVRNIAKRSQLLVTDTNFMMDALKPETIKGLEETAKVMVSNGFEKDFSDLYSNCRKECLNKFLTHKLIGLKKLSIEEVHNMPWKDLEDEIERWIKAFNVAVKILFPGERRLCDRVFFGFSSAADSSFIEICRESIIQLLNFADFVATGRRSPECMIKILQVFETLRDLASEFESLFCEQYSVFLRNEAIKISKRLGEAIKGIFMELVNLIGRDQTNVAVTTGGGGGGGLHPITQYVINYLRVVCRYRGTLEQVFDDCSLCEQMHMIMNILESNLVAKSKCYEDSSLRNNFMINNNTYIIQMIKDNELGMLLGDEWIQKRIRLGDEWIQKQINLQDEWIQKRNHLEDEWSQKQFKKSQGSIPTSEQLQYHTRPDNVHGIPFLPSESESYQNLGKPLETGIRTVVIYDAPHFGNMPPEDGFTWKNYAVKESIGFKYPRSYYRCNNRKLYGCRARKQVEQLNYNLNMFEVIYHGAHSCCVSLTIPSLFLQAPVNISIAPSPTSYSNCNWLSSNILVDSLNSLPGAMLDAPADGGHHPMIEKFMDRLVFYLTSKQMQMKASSNEDGSLSFSAQTNMAIDILESILAPKSEKYVDPALPHFFMMNNWRYLEVNKLRRLDAIFGHVWFVKNRVKFKKSLELYKKNSWDKVLDFLMLDNIDSLEPISAKDLMKEKLSLFNMNFAKACRVQCTWSVHDMMLREEIISSLKNILLPAYGIFIGKFQDLLKNHAYEYIEYGMFDIQDILENLFLGNKKLKI